MPESITATPGHARRHFAVAAAAAGFLLLAGAARSATSLDPLLAELPPQVMERAVVTFDRPPDSNQIAALQAAGFTVSTPFTQLPMAVIDGPAGDMLELQLEGLRSVYLDRPQQLLLDLTVAKVTDNGAAYAADCGGQPCNGAGITVAVIDTGIDGTHPDLCVNGLALTPALPSSDALCPGATPVVLQNVEVLTDDPMNPVIVEGIANTDQTGGHGTHVASIVAGQGQASLRFTGTAPGARLVGVSAGEAVAVLNTSLAIDWVINNRHTYGIRVINNSWGAPAGTAYDPAHPVLVASSAAADAGLVVVFSAGNSGPGTGSMNMYSANPDVLSVAAGENRAVTPDDIAQGNLIPRDPIESPAAFSAAGVPGSEVLHPDLMAPGQFIIAARATTGFSGAADAATDPVFMSDPNELQHYTTHSGTSMAAPHVSGIAAMVWQAALSVDPAVSAETVREILLNTVNPFQPGTVWQQYRAGRGYLNGAAAVNQALAGAAAYTDGVDDAPGPSIVTDVTAFGGSLGSGASTSGCPSNLGTEDPLVPRHAFEVFADALTMDVMLDWAVAGLDLELCLYTPGGVLENGQFRVESDSASAPVDRVHLPAPTAGLWTVEVRGPAALEAFNGYSSVVYPAPPPPLDPVMVLSPAAADRQTGEVHAVRATLTDDTGPVVGADIQWAMAGAGQWVSTDSATGADGSAEARVTSSDPGSTTVHAASGSAGAQASTTWTEVVAPDLLPGRAWGAGHLASGEKLNLNVRRETINGPVTGHLKFTADERFEAGNFLALEISGDSAQIQAEGSWNGHPGYSAAITIIDQGDPGKNIDEFSVTVSSADGSLVATAEGTIASGNLKLE